MSWVAATLNSSIGKKLIVALSGGFLMVFLIGHVSGNLQIFLGDEGESFNKYAKFMTSNPGIKVLSYLTYASFILHIVYSLSLAVYNRKARPVKYAKINASENSQWAARNMALLGTLLLIFIIMHLWHFWFQYHFGPMTTVEYEGIIYQDLFKTVTVVFSEWYWVAAYVILMVALAFHLSHGFSSAFQTLGLNHKKYNSLIKKVGIVYSIVIPALFASMPLYVYLVLN